MGGNSGGGGRSGRGGGDAGQPGEVVRAANQMLENLRSGKLSLKDAETAADGLLTASMKARTGDEVRAYGKKYKAAMDAIDAYKSGQPIEKNHVKKSTKQDNDSRWSRNPDGSYTKNW